eukprot:TRINITY_DN10577_c0_g1_i1.p1 TRINITY_DN10577_c0_g1~~TRINITY_DN10577_c0_g1_i1.p1  ORF type:complete len:572 (-),score=153.64 TRINITY_DN10577_c0_g1_i1:210-1925(-)
MAANTFEAFWSGQAEGKLQRVPLLKAVEAATARLFETDVLDKIDDQEWRQQVRRVVLESNMGGLEEFGEKWYDCVREKMKRMNFCAEWITLAMEKEACGFDLFERAFITGAAKMLPSYHALYLAYLGAVQDPAVKDALKATPPAADDELIQSHYTVVQLAADKTLTAEPFARHFSSCLAPILTHFDEWIASCKAAANTLGNEKAGPWDAAARETYIAFIEQYRVSTALDDSPQALEAAWTLLDYKWMDTGMPLQLVHDIEDGYGDPLCVKATPDMSLRFLDETYAEANATIKEIQQHLEAFYRERDTPLARSGLKALATTMAGIYFIPFKTGASLQFSFSGQSIPNRVDVSEDKGIKIYFDAVETAARVEINKRLIQEVFHEAAAETGVLTKFEPEAVEQLVYHVAAHEVGHAIYNLRNVEKSLPFPSISLEEPRAELTAMFTLKLLHEKHGLPLPKLQKALAHFCLDGLRYFDKYDSSALRPYIIFQIYAYKVYAQTGYLTIHPVSGLLVLDESKTTAALDVFSECFLRILDLMDKADGAALQQILETEMAPENDFVRTVLKLLPSRKDK